LRKLAPGVLWVAALLATMLSLPRLFADDHRDGTLEQLALAPQPLGLIVHRQGRSLTGWSPACRWRAGTGAGDPVRPGRRCAGSADPVAC
jgi:hypothetical protein